MGRIIKQVTLWGKRKKNIKALIDTGSTTSYLREDVAKNLSLVKGERIKVHDESGWVYGYKSSALISFGRGKNTIAIKLIIVKKQTFSLLIGQDFLQREDVNVDFVHDRIQVAKKYRMRKYYR